jgi:hypothetical protein
MTTSEKYLTAGLTLSVILNIIFWYKLTPGKTDCFATSGYEEPLKINKDEAIRYTDEYKGSLVSPDTTLGCIITRSAFDEMMCLENCNAISIMFAKDASGSTGPGGNGTFVIFAGAQVEVDPETRAIREVRNIGSDYYLPHNWCPPSCLPF